MNDRKHLAAREVERLITATRTTPSAITQNRKKVCRLLLRAVREVEQELNRSRDGSPGFISGAS